MKYVLPSTLHIFPKKFDLETGTTWKHPPSFVTFFWRKKSAKRREERCKLTHMRANSRAYTRH